MYTEAAIMITNPVISGNGLMRAPTSMDMPKNHFTGAGGFASLWLHF
jgi:hypothetical protein